MKLAIVTNILTPYRIPLFAAMAEQVDSLTILLMAEREENRQWELGSIPFTVQMLPGFHIRPRRADVSIHLNYGVIRALRKLNPDVVLSGGFAAANVAAFVYCRLFRKKYVAWTHLTLQDGAESSRIRRWIRHLVIGSADGAIAESSVARDAFVHYGAPPRRVLRAVMPLDVSRIHERTGGIRRSPGHQVLRGRYPGVVLLSIGQLIPRKGYREMLEIYRRVALVRPDVSLVILGDGPERASLERMVSDQRIPHVFFEGYVQAEELPQYFACADLFVFHTLYDAFGLVLSEAMAAELPVVSSVHAAATRDLVKEGVTGFSIDPHAADASAATIVKLLNLPHRDRISMGRAGYEHVRAFDAVPSAARIVGFMRSLTEQSDQLSLGEGWEGNP
ncbi:MAG: glycosyltransferase family 4 protein [Nitrospira sp.]|nr:glycosyltransferase family 4 protein [Nitrospira sp.]